MGFLSFFFFLTISFLQKCRYQTFQERHSFASAGGIVAGLESRWEAAFSAHGRQSLPELPSFNFLQIPL